MQSNQTLKDYYALKKKILRRRKRKLLLLLFKEREITIRISTIKVEKVHITPKEDLANLLAPK